MKKLKYLSIILLFSLSFTFLSSCLKINRINSEKETTTEKTRPTKESNSPTIPSEETTLTENSEVTSEETALSQVVLPSESIYSYQFTLDGKLYQLPMEYSVLAADGWDFEENFKGTSIAPDDSFYESLYKNGTRIRVKFLNVGTAVLPLDKCGIASIEIRTPSWGSSDLPSFSLPGGITVNSSYEDIISAYGEPSYTYSTTESLAYGPHYSSEILFKIQDEKIREISVSNKTVFPNTPIDLSAPPSEISDYVPPTELGTSPESFIINLEGDFYTLPAPITAFLSNGWEFASDPHAEIVSAKKRSNDLIYLRKNNQFLFMPVSNYSDTVQPLFFCFIDSFEVSISSRIHRNQISLELPGNITIHSSPNEILAAYGKPNIEIENIKIATETYQCWSWTYDRNYSSHITFHFIVEEDEMYTDTIQLRNGLKN